MKKSIEEAGLVLLDDEQYYFEEFKCGPKKQYDLIYEVAKSLDAQELQPGLYSTRPLRTPDDATFSECSHPAFTNFLIYDRTPSHSRLFLKYFAAVDARVECEHSKPDPKISNLALTTKYKLGESRLMGFDLDSLGLDSKYIWGNKTSRIDSKNIPDDDLRKASLIGAVMHAHIYQWENIPEIQYLFEQELSSDEQL